MIPPSPWTQKVTFPVSGLFAVIPRAGILSGYNLTSQTRAAQGKVKSGLNHLKQLCYPIKLDGVGPVDNRPSTD